MSLCQSLGPRPVGAHDKCDFGISLNEQHSALVFRLSRFRQNDPYCQWAEAPSKRLAAMDHPALEDQAMETAGVEFPEYDLRRAATARDPYAVIEGYRV